jgi:hypothetical protein
MDAFCASAIRYPPKSRVISEAIALKPEKNEKRRKVYATTARCLHQNANSEALSGVKSAAGFVLYAARHFSLVKDEQRSRRVNGIYMLSSQRKSGMVPVGNQQMAMNGKLKAEDLP